MPNKDKNIPKRRFKEFENADAWELRKLGEVADIIGGGTPSTSNSEFWDGDIDWYTPAEIGEQIYVDGSERKITQLGLDKSSATLLPANKTILFTSRAGIGKTAILRSDATTNQGFQSIVVDNNTEPYFIFSMTDKIKNKAISVASGSTFAEISSRALGQLEFMFPSINEQKAIGTFFSTLDQHITLHQRKLDKLKSVKQAYLSEMFPAEGERVPKRRFPGFTDDWELRKFKDILKTHSFRSYLAGVSENGEYEVIQQGDKPIVGYSDGEPFTDYKDVTLFGDHTVSLYKPKSPFFVATDGVKILSADNFEGDYLYTTLERYKPEPQGYKRHFTILKNQDVCFTENMEEQQKIGAFFKKIDETITLHQRKLEKLKNLKKALLNELFV